MFCGSSAITATFKESVNITMHKASAISDEKSFFNTLTLPLKSVKTNQKFSATSNSAISTGLFSLTEIFDAAPARIL
jgi:hypothetical protein